MSERGKDEDEDDEEDGDQKRVATARFVDDALDKSVLQRREANSEQRVERAQNRTEWGLVLEQKCCVNFFCGRLTHCANSTRFLGGTCCCFCPLLMLLVFSNSRSLLPLQSAFNDHADYLQNTLLILIFPLFKSRPFKSIHQMSSH